MKKFLFGSAVATYPPLLRVAEILVQCCGLEGYVIAPEAAQVPVVHEEEVKGASDFDPAATHLKVHFLSARRGDVWRFGFETGQLLGFLKEIKPDYVWLHDEFWGGICQQFLWIYRFQDSPRIIANIAANHIQNASPLFFARFPFVSRTRLKQLLLWKRLNGVCACATKSMLCARRMGLPETVPIVVNYLPVLGPDDAAGDGLPLPWTPGEAFIVGFAGLLSEQKGWKILLQAMEQLPQDFKVVLIGDGEQRHELEARLKESGLDGRAFYAGLLSQRQLLACYPQFDAVVLPAVTTGNSVEQFGRVLAEAMACGVPVIGSDSGAIPEVVGDGGLIVEEGDPGALAAAIRRMKEEKGLRQRSIAWGLERVRNAYSCEAYANSISKLLEIE